MTAVTQWPLAPTPAPARPTSAIERPQKLIVMNRKSTLPDFLARLRADYPGTTFALSEADVAALGPNADVVAHGRLMKGEALICDRHG